MTYKYMDDLDYRLMFISGLLHGKTEDKVIVDLNCGKAPLLKYLCNCDYFCNDISSSVWRDVEENFYYNNNVRVYDLPVDRFVDLLIKKYNVDILLALGLVDGRLTGSKEESNTLIESIIRLAQEKQPEHIILEISARWEQLYHILHDLRLELTSYEEQGEWIITPTNYPDTPEGSLYPRRILHLTPK